LTFLESSKEHRTIRKRITLWDILSELGGMLEIIVIGAPLFILSFRKFKLN